MSSSSGGLESVEVGFPGLAAALGVPQDARWHPEGAVVSVHLGMAGDQAARIARRDGLDDEETFILVLAAMTHDFGKAQSTKIMKFPAGNDHFTGGSCTTSKDQR